MDDLIRRHDAIDAVRKSYDEILDFKSNGHTIADSVEDIIEALPSAQQWIPVNERLPEEDGQYLITVKYVHIDGYDDIYAEHGEWVDGKWDMFCFGHCGQVETILAWMPLPEPWKGDENG